MKLLAIDSSNKTMSVALVDDNQVVKEITKTNTLQHSTELMPAIEELFANAPFSLHEIHRIVVAQGPGSYTGLRIGVSIAKTLAYTTKCALVGVSSLAVLAANVQTTDAVIVPFFDARRDYIFTGAYEYTNEHQLVPVLEDVHISWDAWLHQLARLEKKLVFVGELTIELKERIIKLLPTATFADEADSVVCAHVLAGLGAIQEPVDVATFVPVYLKLAEAEENWRKEHNVLGEENYVERL